MHAIANLVGLVLFVFECLLVLVNWIAAFQNARNRRRGIDRHVSGVTLVPQVLMLVAAQCFNTAQAPWLPVWLPFLVGMADIALLRMLLILVAKLSGNGPKHG